MEQIQTTNPHYLETTTWEFSSPAFCCACMWGTGCNIIWLCSHSAQCCVCVVRQLFMCDHMLGFQAVSQSSTLILHNQRKLIWLMLPKITNLWHISPVWLKSILWFQFAKKKNHTYLMFPELSATSCAPPPHWTDLLSWLPWRWLYCYHMTLVWHFSHMITGGWISRYSLLY